MAARTERGVPQHAIDRAMELTFRHRPDLGRAFWLRLVSHGQTTRGRRLRRLWAAGPLDCRYRLRAAYLRYLEVRLDAGPSSNPLDLTAFLARATEEERVATLSEALSISLDLDDFDTRKSWLRAYEVAEAEIARAAANALALRPGLGWEFARRRIARGEIAGRRRLLTLLTFGPWGLWSWLPAVLHRTKSRRSANARNEP